MSFYSEAMKRYNVVWDEKALDRSLANLMKVVPGTSMAYAGIPDQREGADLIAYLKQANTTPACKQ